MPSLHLHLHQAGQDDYPVEPALTFPYELDDFQKHAICGIEAGHHVLATAHTGSGKTTIAEYAIAHTIKHGGRVIYTAPIKALSNQIYADFRRKYPHWQVGIRTGDIDLNSDAQIVIMTTEILRNILFRDKDTVLALVIFDEVHYIKDHERGSVWEESIMLMPAATQMIMLSATLSDAEDFARWIMTCKDRDVTYTTTEQRVVPLTHYIMADMQYRRILDNDGTFYPAVYDKARKEYNFVPSQLNLYLQGEKSGSTGIALPALFFCFSRLNCERYAHNVRLPLVSSLEAANIDKLFTSLLRKFDKQYDTLACTQELRGLLCKGVGYHHAGLFPALKEIVQELFTGGHIKVLFVTETFAAGVNMPAKTVVFTGLTKYDDATSGFRALLPEEYRQMAGRAGRRGLDKSGTVILLPFNHDDLLPTEDMKRMMCGTVRKIESRLNLDYSYIIKTIMTGGDIYTSYKGSLLDEQYARKMEYHQVRLRELKTFEVKAEKTGKAEKSGFFEIKEDLLPLFSLQSMIDSGIGVDKKRLKRHKLDISAAETSTGRSFKDIYQDYLIQKERAIAIKAEQDSIDYYSQSIDEIITERLSQLKQRGYIDTETNRTESKLAVTVKGILYAEVNECSPALLLIEALTRGLFAGMTIYELLESLAIFIDVEDTKDRGSEEDTGQASVPRLTGCVQRLLKLAEELDLPTPATKYCWIARDWITTHDLSKVTVFPGEFVKNMLKLANIGKELRRIAEISHNDELFKTLENCTALIVQGVVTPQSLYLV